ncbi:acyl-phosphate glycerol 3-phosphate acyltransferase [Salipaludibacillus keqinensis]|uniref:Glycerol-3-phosphate acyltransferase n=1 Tax=Salipaludibacillus keqinensis TaxID=2045207 RepID=A0A323TY85_9BACI|nr:glycerol-3-phosphate 1-O-acyltransferase PlsY [Salipaludibacillus keqinensis]PYZ94495.1 acyl-phosphate glycerol 3-phosphate acyltransferase [Salipaludibacillus keqinensis]
MTAVFAIILSYLIGAVSFSYVIGKRFRKLDIREHGSGNAGATNTLRVMGIAPAVAVLLLDCGKGILAVWIGYGLSGGDPLIAAASGLASILGHNWPVYYGFRGGKGVATTIGVVATLVFFPALISGIVAILAIVFTRFVSLGSLLFILGTTLITALFSDYFNVPFYFVYFLLFISGLSIWKHRTNIERLVKGEESKLGEKTSVK